MININQPSTRSLLRTVLLSFLGFIFLLIGPFVIYFLIKTETQIPIFLDWIITLAYVGGVVYLGKVISKKIAPKDDSKPIITQEINKEVENYNSLSFLKTARGTAVWLLGFLVFIHLVLFFQHSYAATDLIAEVIIYSPLAFFISKGKRWSIILAMMVLTTEFFLWFIASYDFVQFVAWIVVITPFLKAFLVETKRSKSTGEKIPLIQIILLILCGLFLFATAYFASIGLMDG